MSRHHLQAGSIARQWKTNVDRYPEGVKVFSPYITSGTADNVLSNAAACEIYTLFEVEVFTFGASSLGTLKKLIQAGHRIYHLPGLHAKIILTGDDYVSVGSQNLTNAGTRKKEFSVSFPQEAIAAKVRQLITPWIEDRILVTPSMIEDMEGLLAPLRRKFKALNKLTNLAQAAFDEKQQARAQAERHRLPKASPVRQAELARQIALRAQSSTTVQARVVYIETSSHTSRTSLKTNTGNLTQWVVGDKKETLSDFHRYLIIHKDTHAIGWARVCKSVITFVAKGVIRSDSLFKLPDGSRYSIEYSAMPPDEESRVNLRISLHCQQDERHDIDLYVWFSPEALDIAHIAYPNLVPNDKGMRAELEARLMTYGDLIESCALEGMTSPFKYDRNKTGSQANAFFGPVGDAFRIQLFMERSHPILLASQIG